MALELIATAGAADANSYADIASADAYHESHVYASTWNSATNVSKAQALVWATRLLDTYFEWGGLLASQSQALRWPRVSALDRDGRLLSGSTIPTDLANATAEFARGLLASDRTAEPSSEGGEIKELKVGPIDITYVEGTSTTAPVVPATVVAMLRHLGTYRSGTGGAISMRRA